ncbi:hypothetical protein NDU88_001277 [Pleurodeles waltl]|uniref:Uncharacterized protein n=1 Tax=Pleurodeles waltl TaxID=8319 RepID=A0AAV7R9T1_PLEWA|nr:hypothetical protein NDU88_001277 [Pleurodeles waltl]
MGGDLNLVQLVEGYGGGGESKGHTERDGEYDPLIPVSSKWPIMLEWSASESDVEQAEAREVASEGASPSLTVRCGVPKKVYGEPARKGPAQLTMGTGPRFFAAKDFVFAGTPDLAGQRERCEKGEPNECRVARSPWTEGQVEPRAAGRSPSPGWTAERRLATDTPGKRCGGRGRAPASATASWERRPGPAGVQTGVRKKSTVETAVGEGPRRARRRGTKAMTYGV